MTTAGTSQRTESPAARHARSVVACATQLRRCFRAHNYQRACGRASWTSGRSLVDKGHSTPARTAVCDDQNLVLVTLASARCSLAVGARDPQRAFTGCSLQTVREDPVRPAALAVPAGQEAQEDGFRLLASRKCQFNGQCSYRQVCSAESRVHVTACSIRAFAARSRAPPGCPAAA